MSNKHSRPGFRPYRHDRLMQDSQGHEQPDDPSVCPGCGAVFHQGRWQWASTPPDAERAQCPACGRIQAKRPAGFFHISGDYFEAHRQDLLQLLSHQADQESAAHPLERVMNMEPDGDGLLVTTTGVHLARRLAEALHRACHGELDLRYNKDEDLLRAHWRR